MLLVCGGTEFMCLINTALIMWSMHAWKPCHERTVSVVPSAKSGTKHAQLACRLDSLHPATCHILPLCFLNMTSVPVLQPLQRPSCLWWCVSTNQTTGVKLHRIWTLQEGQISIIGEINMNKACVLRDHWKCSRVFGCNSSLFHLRANNRLSVSLSNGSLWKWQNTN